MIKTFIMFKTSLTPWRSSPSSSSPPLSSHHLHDFHHHHHYQHAHYYHLYDHDYDHHHHHHHNHCHHLVLLLLVVNALLQQTFSTQVLMTLRSIIVTSIFYIIVIATPIPIPLDQQPHIKNLGAGDSGFSRLKRTSFAGFPCASWLFCSRRHLPRP